MIIIYNKTDILYNIKLLNKKTIKKILSND